MCAQLLKQTKPRKRKENPSYASFVCQVQEILNHPWTHRSLVLWQGRAGMNEKQSHGRLLWGEKKPGMLLGAA